MAVSKVILNGTTLMDVTDKTVTAASLVSPNTALKNDGTTITGSLVSKSSSDVTVSGTTVTVPSGVYSSPVTVNVSGGGGSDNKLVNFIDYDGTLLHSYTASEWANVSALPSNPSHTGLTSQGWNWTKAQIDAQLTAHPDQVVRVGQMYITTSGDTEIDITLDDPKFLSPYLCIAVNGTVEIDWGDNSSTDTLAGTSDTSIKSVAHQYASVGDYTIKISVSSGSFSFTSSGTGYGAVLSESNTSTMRRTYSKDIKHIRLGSSVNIKNYAFSNCYALTSLTIPSGVTSIGDSTFWACYALTSLTIPSSVTSIISSIFYNCYALTSPSIPGGVTSIGYTAFAHCYTLTSLTIPSSVTSIGNSAFSNCYALTSLTIPSGVTSIGTSAFGSCYTLASLTIPSGVTSIGNGAFQNCYTLASLTIPSGVTSIGNSVFQNCYALTSLTIPSGVTSIGLSAFAGCYTLTSLTIPSSVTSIGNFAFQNCYTLTSLTIPSGVTSIGNGAFQSCYTLASLTIPSGVTSIGTSAFQNCYALTSLTIPSGVTSIGNSAFSSCNSMMEYHFLSEDPPTLGTTAFASIRSGTVIYVPAASVDDYKTATNWSTYASYIQGE